MECTGSGKRFQCRLSARFLPFFKEIGCRYIQFTPIVERIFRHADGRYLASVEEGAEETVTDFQ